MIGNMARAVFASQTRTVCFPAWTRRGSFDRLLGGTRPAAPIAIRRAPDRGCAMAAVVS